MLKRLSIICILLAIALITQAQKWKESVDSLQNLLKTEESDTARMFLYLDLSDLFTATEPSEAMNYAVKAKMLADRLGHKKGLVNSMLKQCDFYSTIGEYNQSLQLAYEALEIAKPDPAMMGFCHNRIATIHAAIDNYEETLYHNKKSLYYSSIGGDSNDIIVDIHNIGRIFTDLKQYDSALFYLRIANKYELDHNNRPDPYSLTNIGNVFLELEEYDSALFYHLQAYKYDVLDDQKYLIGIDQQFIASTYLKMKRYAEAKEYALSSIGVAEELDAYDLALENYETLYKIYQNEGDYRKAFDYAMLYNSTKDTLYENAKQSLILGLETKHRVKEQEEQLALLKRQKTLYFILTLVSVMFVVSMIFIVLLIARRQRLTQELMKQLQLANDSKERLLSVISHDLRGSVGTMRSAARAIMEGISDTSEDIRLLLESFYPVADSTYELLENLLTWAKCNREKISPEIVDLDIKNLVDMSIKHTEHLAQAKSIRIINNLSSQTIRADKDMVLSIMRNLLGNAIKFSHPKSKVLIAEDFKEDQYVISVADNGLGIQPEVLANLFESPEIQQSAGTMGERGSGLGLMICKTFINAIGGEIWAESTPGKGTTFYFTLPLK